MLSGLNNTENVLVVFQTQTATEPIQITLLKKAKAEGKEINKKIRKQTAIINI